MGASAAPGAAPQEEAALDRVLAEVAGITGSHAAGVFLLVPNAQALRLAVVTGLSAGAVRPWSRLALATPAPVSVVAGEGHPVWVHGHDELARRFPRTAFALPYRLAMYVVPLHTGTTVSGVLQLLWPDTRPERLSPDERAAVTRAADRMGGLLTQAAARGRPLRPGAVPRVLAPDPPPPVPSAEAQAADLAERLNEGVLALDLEGRVTFLNSRAAELLGRDKRQLMRTRLWESLPWLIDPAYEDPYLAALFSRLPTDFTALRPPDDWLSFRLYPDTTGISIRLRTAPAPAGNRLPPTTPSGTAPTRAGALYRLLYIASSLTEAVGVRDVAASVPEQIMPVLGADGLSPAACTPSSTCPGTARCWRAPATCPRCCATGRAVPRSSTSRRASCSGWTSPRSTGRRRCRYRRVTGRPGRRTPAGGAADLGRPGRHRPAAGGPGAGDRRVRGGTAVSPPVRRGGTGRGRPLSAGAPPPRSRRPPRRRAAGAPRVAPPTSGRGAARRRRRPPR